MSDLRSLAATMGEIAPTLGPCVTLEPFLLPEKYIKEIRQRDSLTGLIQHGWGDDNTAWYAFLRAHMAFEIDSARYPVFKTVTTALLPGTAQGAVYIDIHFGELLYNHIVISYRGIPDDVVAWVLKGLFDIDVVVAKRG